MLLKPEDKEARKIAIMEKCFAYYCKNGLNETGMNALAKACGMNQSSFYTYFENLDELIVQSTEYCMTKVEDDFMAHAPTKREDVPAFFREAPYWSAKLHGEKYRFMYQVYSSPKYIRYGQAFFEGVNKRYAEYSEKLAADLRIPKETVLAVIFLFVRASVHYAMFNDEYYLKLETGMLAEMYKKILADASEENNNE